MSTAKHTPGPWYRNSADNQVYDSDGGLIAAEIMGENAGVYRANAQLIASAPELLEALEAAWQQIQAYRSVYPMHGNIATIQQIEAAIAKAGAQ